MLSMVRKALAAFTVLLAVSLIAGCRSEEAPQPLQSTLTIAPPQNPYRSTTRTPAPPTATVSIPTEQPLLPSPTPFKHTIQSGDTLYAIALQYNISLDSLVSANPGADTSLLTVGTELVIPFPEEGELSVPTPTPFSIPVSDPTCYPSRTGGAWCITLAENYQTIPLENIAAAINIYDRGTELVGSYIAIPPINYLSPGETLPLLTYIDGNLPDAYQSNAVLLTSLPAEDYTSETEIINQYYQYQDGNKIAHINGFVSVSGTDLKGSRIWIAAVAYNDGSPVGIRKWLSSEGISPEEEIPFDFVLYSLGPPIDRIKLFSELHR